MPINEAETASSMNSFLKEKDCFAKVHAEIPLEIKIRVRKSSADIIIVTHDGKEIIFELKRRNAKVHFRTLAEIALKKIWTNDYDKTFQKKDYRDLITKDKILIGWCSYDTERKFFSLLSEK